jgi:hypothetical protein
LASIRSQKLGRNVSPTELKRTLTETKVPFKEEDGKVVVSRDDVLGFLEVLDRRRYEITLVEGEPELFRATSRRKLP